MTAHGRVSIFRPALVVTGLVLTYVVAVWVRLQYFAILGGAEGDYVEWAIHNGLSGGLSIPHLENARSIVAGNGYGAVAYAPGFAVFLAMLDYLGLGAVQHMRVAMAFVDASAVGAIYCLLRYAGCRRVASVLGGVLYAVLPSIAMAAVTLLPEGLSTVVILWGGVLVLTVSERGSKSAAFVAGLLLGGASMLRSDLVLLGPAVTVWCLLRSTRPRRLLRAALLAAGFGAVLLLWGAHNKKLHDHWLFSTTAGGTALWQGLADMPNDLGFVLSDARAAELAAEHGVSYLDFEGNRILRGYYLDAIKQHPGHAVRVVLWRWKQIASVINNREPYFLANFVAFLSSYGFACLLLAIVLSPSWWPRIFVLVAPFAYACGSIGLVHYESRYVTYAHVSYLLALPALLDSVVTLMTRGPAGLAVGRLILRLARRGAHVAVQAPAWRDSVAKRVAITLCAVAIAGLAVYVGPRGLGEIGDLREAGSRARRGAEVRQKLMAAREIGGLRRIIDLGRIAFRRESVAAIVTEADGAVRVETDESITAIQFEFDLDIGDADGAVIDIGTTILEPGGLLFNFFAGGVVVETRYVWTGGSDEILVAIPSVDAKAIRVQAASYNFSKYPDPSKAIVRFHHLDVYVLDEGARGGE